jgi:hypothetical protein
VALGCVVASARRLAVAVAPTALEPRAVLKVLQGDRGAAMVAALRAVVADDEALAWERDLFAAFAEPPGPRRDALVNEQLLDLEGRAEAGSRVPRVCASVGTSSGLLFGSIALLEGLESPEGQDATAAMHDAFASAMGALALGIAATAFCVAVYIRARKVARERRVAIDELVERLERLA